ncbi:MAG TPA: hypothetical protein VK404_18895 [Spirosoma sp.]|jgi:hypothetical protein|nr:hypothetical protein [Spirosoma sp.]
MEHEKAPLVEPVGLKKHNSYKTVDYVFLLSILKLDMPFLALYSSDLLSCYDMALFQRPFVKGHKQINLQRT